MHSFFICKLNLKVYMKRISVINRRKWTWQCSHTIDIKFYIAAECSVNLIHKVWLNLIIQFIHCKIFIVLLGCRVWCFNKHTQTNICTYPYKCIYGKVFQIRNDECNGKILLQGCSLFPWNPGYVQSSFNKLSK